MRDVSAAISLTESAPLRETRTNACPFVSRSLGQAEGPVIAVSDSLKLVPDQISRWVHQPFVPLGTDGFGRSDTREALRRFFEIDAEHVVVAVLSALADMGEVKPEKVSEAIARYEIDAERPSPTSQELDRILRAERTAEQPPESEQG